MDVIGLSKNGIENTVANLGTALTSKQIQILNQFYNHIIICFDGDESGYKAALRAAENSIKDLRPDKNISFLFLPNKEDPDSFVNKNGKSIHLEKFPSIPENWKNSNLETKWSELIKIRDICNISIEEKRASKVIGSSLEANLVIKLEDKLIDFPNFDVQKIIDKIKAYFRDWPQKFLEEWIGIVQKFLDKFGFSLPIPIPFDLCMFLEQVGFPKEISVTSATS